MCVGPDCPRAPGSSGPQPRSSAAWRLPCPAPPPCAGGAHVAYLSHLLAKNGSGFFVGQGPTIAGARAALGRRPLRPLPTAGARGMALPPGLPPAVQTSTL